MNPSAYESFSLVVLEAWTLGVPVLVNGGVRGHHGALPAIGRRTVVRLLPVLRGHRRPAGRRPGLRAGLGEAGRRYTARYYRWPSIIDRYTAFLDGVVARGRRAPVPDPAAGPAGRRPRLRSGRMTAVTERPGPTGGPGRTVLATPAPRRRRDRAQDGGAEPDGRPSPADERELLAAFDRLSPQGDAALGLRRRHAPDRPARPDVRRGRRAVAGAARRPVGAGPVGAKAIGAVRGRRGRRRWPRRPEPPTRRGRPAAAAASGGRVRGRVGCPAATWPPGWSVLEAADRPARARGGRVAGPDPGSAASGRTRSTPGWVRRTRTCPSWWASRRSGGLARAADRRGSQRSSGWSPGARRHGGRWSPPTDRAGPGRRARPTWSRRRPPGDCPPPVPPAWSCRLRRPARTWPARSDWSTSRSGSSCPAGPSSCWSPTGRPGTPAYAPGPGPAARDAPSIPRPGVRCCAGPGAAAGPAW